MTLGWPSRPARVRELISRYQRAFDAFKLSEAAVATQHSMASIVAGDVRKYLRFAARATSTRPIITGLNERPDDRCEGCTTVDAESSNGNRDRELEIV